MKSLVLSKFDTKHDLSFNISLNTPKATKNHSKGLDPNSNELEVTHNVFFGENIKRVINAISGHK